MGKDKVPLHLPLRHAAALCGTLRQLCCTAAEIKNKTACIDGTRTSGFPILDTIGRYILSYMASAMFNAQWP
jgi:hypothetical protein